MARILAPAIRIRRVIDHQIACLRRLRGIHAIDEIFVTIAERIGLFPIRQRFLLLTETFVGVTAVGKSTGEFWIDAYGRRLILEGAEVVFLMLVGIAAFPVVVRVFAVQAYRFVQIGNRLIVFLLLVID